MNQPVLYKPAWHVYTTNAIYSIGSGGCIASWVWTANGPRGSKCGIEETADAATEKAMLAAGLLDEPRHRRAENAA